MNALHSLKSTTVLKSNSFQNDIKTLFYPASRKNNLHKKIEVVTYSSRTLTRFVAEHGIEKDKKTVHIKAHVAVH